MESNDDPLTVRKVKHKHSKHKHHRKHGCKKHKKGHPDRYSGSDLDLPNSNKRSRSRDDLTDDLRRDATPSLSKQHQQISPLVLSSSTSKLNKLNSPPPKELLYSHHSRSKDDLVDKRRRSPPPLNSSTSKYWSPTNNSKQRINERISPPAARSPPHTYSDRHNRSPPPISYPSSRELSSRELSSREHRRTERASSRDKYREQYDSRERKRSAERSSQRKYSSAKYDRPRDRSYSRSPYKERYDSRERRRSPYSNSRDRQSSNRLSSRKSPRHHSSRHSSRTPTRRNRYSASPRTPPSSPESSVNRIKWNDQDRNAYPIETTQFSATSLAAELIKQKKLKRKETFITESTSQLTINQQQQTQQPSHHQYSFSPSNHNNQNKLQEIPSTSAQFGKQQHKFDEQLQSNGFLNLKTSTLPQLPLPISNNDGTSKTTSRPRLALTQLPMPPGSNSPIVNNEPEEFVTKFNKKRRPKIVNKVYPITSDRTPRCIEVFDIICQIGEG